MAVMSKNLRLNKRGMSIVSVLVGASIGIVVITGLISMITDVFKSQRSAQSKDAQRELIAGIRHLLSDPVICAASFGGGKPIGGGFNPTQIKDGATPPNIKYETGVNYINNLVTITRFTVRSFAEDNPANPQNGKAELVVDTKKIGATIGGEQMKGTILLLQVVLDASNNISQCYALGSADSLWQISPVDSADIYYSGGNVGIGTTTPETILTIKSSRPEGVWPGGGDALILRSSTGAHEAYLGVDDNHPWVGSNSNEDFRIGIAGATKIIVQPNGNVGIGTIAPEVALVVARADGAAIASYGRINTAIIGIENETLPHQGAYISWNETNGLGETNFSNHRGGGTEGGFNFNLFDGTGNFVSTPMVIRGDKVGIGTAGPAYNLDIIGKVDLNTVASIQGSGDVSRLLLRNTGPSGKAWSVSSYKNTLTPNGGLVIADETAAAVRMVIDGSGNVGIGTNNPAAVLDVKNGKIHGQLNCRKTSGPSGTNGSIANCASDEYVISGGGRCETIPDINPGFLHRSEPLDDLSGWEADCYKWDWSTDNLATAFAICCKK